MRRDPTIPSGHGPYLAELQKMAELHCKKAADYGVRGGDPLANLRATEQLGVPAWRGALIRASDKWSRIMSFLQNGDLANESFEDSLIDMAAYLLLAKVLRDEENAAVGKDARQKVKESMKQYVDERSVLSKAIAGRLLEGHNPPHWGP